MRCALVGMLLVVATSACGVVGPPDVPRPVSKTERAVEPNATRVTLPLRVDGERQEDAWQCLSICRAGSSDEYGFRHCIASCPDAVKERALACGAKAKPPQALCFVISDEPRKTRPDDTSVPVGRLIVGTVAVAAYTAAWILVGAYR